jgi:hypothetical protein
LPVQLLHDLTSGVCGLGYGPGYHGWAFHQLSLVFAILQLVSRAVGILLPSNGAIVMPEKFWFFKALLLVVLCACNFLVYDARAWTQTFMSLPSICVFIFFQSLLLSQFAHNWSNCFWAKIDSGPRTAWLRCGMAIAALGYVAAIAVTCTGFVAVDNCESNVLTVLFLPVWMLSQLV